MTSKRESYFFLNCQGKCSLPNNQEVRSSDASNSPFTLILDNNVCTHISETGSLKQDKSKKKKVDNFLNYCRTSNITIVPAFGLIERASFPGTLELNKDRLAYSENILWQNLGHYVSNDSLSSQASTIEPLKTLLYPFYAYMLKIKLILIERTPSQANAEKNFQDLYEFISQADIFLALPWQFALAIFGGETTLNKFIRPRKGDVIRSLWAAAWDLFYISQIHQFNGLRKLNDRIFPRFILATDDELCAKIADFTKVSSAFKYGEVTYNVPSFNTNFPHIKGESNYLHTILFDLNVKVHQRAYADSRRPQIEFQNDIAKKIDKISCFILEFTEKIKTQERKGFG